MKTGGSRSPLWQPDSHALPLPGTVEAVFEIGGIRSPWWRGWCRVTCFPDGGGDPLAEIQAPGTRPAATRPCATRRPGMPGIRCFGRYGWLWPEPPAGADPSP